MEDDDPVVREIPVHLATELSDVLYLVQHPHFNVQRVEPNSSALGEPPLPISAKIRPKHGKLELFTTIPKIDGDDVHEHYDEDASPRQCIKEHRFVSNKVELQTHFSVGAMREGALHITPVRRILQMRASLAHIDQFEERELMEMELIDDQGAEVTTKKETKTAKPPVMSGYQKRESDRAKNARLTSWAHQHQSEMAENFVTLDVHGAGTAISDDEFQRMFCPSVGATCLDFGSLVGAGADTSRLSCLSSSEPASIAANHPDLPASISQLTLRIRLFLFACAHAFIQQHGVFTRASMGKPGFSRELFQTMCEEAQCAESVAVEAFLYFCSLTDFSEASLSNPFASGKAHYCYLTEEPSQRAKEGARVGAKSDELSVAAKNCTVANALAQEHKDDLKAAVRALIANEVYTALLFKNAYSLPVIEGCSLEDKVHAVIRRATVIPYDMLLALTPGAAHTAIEVALKFAHLVRGSLVLKSECLYGGELAVISLATPSFNSFLSALSTPPSTAADRALCDARDSILAIIERDGHVFRLPLTSIFEHILTPFQIKTLLLSFSVLDRPTRRWFPKHAEGSAQSLRIAFPHLKCAMKINQAMHTYMDAYDTVVADTLAAKGSAAFGPSDPRRVDMIDAMPGFDLAYTGGRKPSTGKY